MRVDLSEHANILFVSDSITDILGWRSHEVQGKSCFDFFHRDEVAAAEKIRARSVLMNKAASLHYIRILSRSGVHVTCECCFSIVHDVLVACTSIYRRTAKSESKCIRVGWRTARVVKLIVSQGVLSTLQKCDASSPRRVGIQDMECWNTCPQNSACHLQSGNLGPP